MSSVARPVLSVTQNTPAKWAGAFIFLADLLALEASFALGMLARGFLSSIFTATLGPEQYLGIAAGILLMPAVYYQVGLYPGYLLGPVERLRRRTLATLAVFGGLVAWDNLVARGVFSRGVLVATLLFALILPPLAETLARRVLERRGKWGIPVVLLGSGDAGRNLVRTLRREPELGLQPVAFLDDRPASWNTAVEEIPVLGPLRLADTLEHRAQAAIVLLADLGAENLADLLQDLNFPRIIVIPDRAGIAGLWVSARDVGGQLGLEIKKNLLIPRNHLLKRLMDQVVALPLFLASLPVLTFAALWIKLRSPGPALYRQMREGFDGRRIPVWKLRTMYTDGDRILDSWFEEHPEDRDQWQRFFKLRHDPRVLPGIGSLLRRTSLDELPQFWSVLKGEMSLVGPRPLPDYHLGQFTPEFRNLRTRVLPGLTGLWQVSARSEGDLKVQQSLDTFYIRNWSPWLDLYILARTVTAVLLARGAY